MLICETERLLIRELEAASDAAFINQLLNSPKFIKYIGDRGVRTEAEAGNFIESRYRQSYTENGFGLYTVELKDGTPIGICGFVSRDTLPAPDIGFAFLPEFERMGYGFESAAAVLDYGRTTLGLQLVLAITTMDNEASARLLQKLGFTFRENIYTETEPLRLYQIEL